MDPYVKTPEIDEYIKKRIEALPKELSVTVSNDSVYDNVGKILESYKLSSDVIEDIKYEVFLILAQILPYDELPAVLMTEYNIVFKDAVSISKEINEKLFKDLMPFLMNVHDEEAETENEVGASTPNVETKDTYKPGSTLPEAESRLKEKLELRPDMPNQREEKEKAFRGPESRPLTREELMKSLSTTRTMAKDMQAVRGNDAKPTVTPPINPSATSPNTALPPNQKSDE